MYGVFVTSTALLIGCILLRYVEMMRGARVYAPTRERVDLWVRTVRMRLQAHLVQVSEYANRDTLVKILHMGTYLVLLLVRVLERKLTTASRILRSIRKKKQSRPISPGLDKVGRGVDPSKEI